MSIIGNRKKICCLAAMIMLVLLLTGCLGNSSQAPESQPLPDHQEEKQAVLETLDKPDTRQNPVFAEENPAKTENDQETEPDETKVTPTETTEATEVTETTTEVTETTTEATETKETSETTETTESKALTEEETNTEGMKVFVTIQGMPETPPIMPTTQVKVEEGDTVLDLLLRITREKQMHMSHRGRGKAGYVEAIDNLYEFDQGPGSGWMFSINGEFPSRSAGGWPVEPNDTITWWYTLDAGRDLEAVKE